MIRQFSAIALLLASAMALSACVVAPGPYAGRPRCPGWVPAHVGPNGVLHPGHCI
jgi:hypothetical protein